MNTNEKTDLMNCERVLALYREVEKAIDDGIVGRAKDKLQELHSLLKNQTQRSAFRGAYSRLPRVSSPLNEWKMYLSDSRKSVEEYEHRLRRMVEQEQEQKKVP